MYIYFDEEPINLFIQNQIKIHKNDENFENFEKLEIELNKTEKIQNNLIFILEKNQKTRDKIQQIAANISIK